MGAISAAVEEARAGRARALLLHGAPGVGKTRLLREAAAQPATAGIRVACSSCLPLTTPLPFDPVLELLRSLGDPLPATRSGSPRELFGMVVDRLEHATVEGPLLLCLDDLQWSDAGTSDLVHYCLARLVDLPIAWLMSARPDVTADRLAHRLGQTGVLEMLELGALSAADTRQLAEEILGRDRVSDRLADALFSRTGGNPFLCEELLRAIADTATPTGAGPAIPAGAGPGEIDQLVPRSVSDSIGDRLSRLPDNAQQALQWAAVLPEPFTFEELERAGGERLGDALETLAAASFLTTDGDAGWRFVHSIVRDAVYRRLPERERVRRHAAVADTLAGAPVERRAPQLAAARRWYDAAAAYLEVANIALNRGHGADAVELYRRSAALAERAGGGRLHRDARAGEVLALVRAGEGEEAARAADALQDRLRAEGEPDELLAFLTRYAIALVDDARDFQRAGEILTEAEPLIAAADGALLAEALAVRAFGLHMQGYDSALALIDSERAVQLTTTTGDPALLARALNAHGHIVGMARDARAGMAILEQGLAVAHAADLPAQEARACMSLSFLAATAGDTEAFEAHSRHGLELEGVPAGLAIALRGNLAAARAWLGDFDGAVAHSLAALREARRVGPQAEFSAALSLVNLYLQRADLLAVRRLLEEHASDDHDRAPLTGTDARRAAFAWGALLTEEGTPTEALDRFEEVTRHEDALSVFAFCGVARTAVAAGKPAVAAEALARLEVLAKRWQIGEWLRDEAQGWVAIGDNRPADAVAAFRAAAEACPEPHESARFALEAARLSGDRDQVRAAIDTFEQMGSKRYADRARAVARSLGMRPGRRRAPAGGLTAREQEIAELVAAGQTNAEIATALHLSPRTVEHYVSNILTKLGYRSRVQIAAEAAAGRLPGSAATTVESTSPPA